MNSNATVENAGCGKEKEKFAGEKCKQPKTKSECENWKLKIEKGKSNLEIEIQTRKGGKKK